MIMLFWKNTLKCYRENLGVEPGIFLLSEYVYVWYGNDRFSGEAESNSFSITWC